MNVDKLLKQVESCADGKLIENLNALSLREKKNAGALIVHLAVIRERRAVLRLGYKSLFAYCEKELRMDPGCIATRMQIAGKCRQYPRLLEELIDGKISQTAAARLCAHLTKENSDELIRAAKRLSVRELEEYLEKTNRKVVVVRPSIRKQRRPLIQAAAKKRKIDDHAAPLFAESKPCNQVGEVESETGRLRLDECNGSTPAERKSAEEIKFNIKFSASGKFKDKLERLAEILGEQNVESALERVVERALDDSLDKRDPARRRARRGLAKKSCGEEKSLARDKKIARKKARAVPRKIYDEVLSRSGYRCEYVGSVGKRCTQTSRLQVDHIRPWGKGGGHNFENLQVLCQSHNLLKAENDFGRVKISRNIGRDKDY